MTKYDTLAFDPKKGDALLSGKGFKKDGGVWADAQGKKLTLDIIGFGASGPAIGPVLSEMLKRHGIEATHEHAARLRRPLPEGPVRRLDLRPRRQRSTIRTRRCGCTRGAASRCPARTW